MAIETFGVVYQDVIDELPSNTRGVTANSQGINFDKITIWIRVGAGQIQGLLERAGVDPATAAAPGTSSREIARNAIIAYVVAKCLSVAMNASDPRIAQALEEWREAKLMLTDIPSSVGASKADSTGVRNNIPTGPRHLIFRNDRW